MKFTRTMTALALSTALVTTSACTTNPETGNRRLSNTGLGAILGAGAGYLLGDIVGGRNSRTEQIVGAGIGALGGAAVGRYMDQQEAELRRETAGTGVDVIRQGDDIVLRMRPSYFPFTEPSAEVDVGYSHEKGRRVVGGSEGWMEVLGSGMVHPRVIAAAGLDPDEWQGFAFGTGIDRLAMLKYGMNDLRQFFDGDIRWLKHYGFSALAIPTLSAGVGA